MTPPRSAFALFPSLPTELRQQIWLEALNQSLNPSTKAIPARTVLRDGLARYRAKPALLQHERRNRAALYTYKPGLWIPEDLPVGDPQYHPNSHINLPFRYDLLDDAHFTSVRAGGVAALLWTCCESRATVLRDGILGDYGLELRAAVCDVAYHHGSMDWFELGEVNRVAMDVDEFEEEKMRDIWSREGVLLETKTESSGSGGVRGEQVDDVGEDDEMMMSFEHVGLGYKAALVKTQQYYCHAGTEPGDCHCHCHGHVAQGQDEHRVTGIVSSSSGPKHHSNSEGLVEPQWVLARVFDPEADLLFIPACAYHVLMIEKPERGFSDDLLGRGYSTGGSFDAVQHVAISEKLFRCVKDVDTVAFVETFSCLESLSILVDGSVGRRMSTSGDGNDNDVETLERTAMSNATKRRDTKALSSESAKQPVKPALASMQFQECAWRRRQRWEVETLAVLPGKSRHDYTYPDNSVELCNDSIANHLFHQRHGIIDPGYQPPVWQASHSVEGLEALFCDLGVKLTIAIEALILEATQLIDFEVRIVRAFRA